MKGDHNETGAYPIIIKRTNDEYYVRIPDFDSGTQGETIADAMEMARDAIGLMGIDMEDENKSIPAPYSVQFNSEKEDIVTLVDVDFSEYRKKWIIVLSKKSHHSILDEC